MSSDAVVALYHDDNGLVLVGDNDDILALTMDWEVESSKVRPLTPDMVAKAGAAVEVASGIRASSAVWLKLTNESMARVAAAQGFSHAKKSKAIAGVLRGQNGRITSHLTFVRAKLNPATVASLGSMATSMAIQAAIQEMADYLKLMDAKLDRLLMERKVEALAELGGIGSAIDEAMSIYEHLGSVSSTTWSKVQANATDLHVAQALALESLRALAMEVEQTGPTAKLGDIAPRIRKDIAFWLAVLARGVALQDTLYVLEIGRVMADNPEELASHREAIQHARAKRLEKIHRTIGDLGERLRVGGVMPNHVKVAHPVKVTRVVESVNAANRELGRFARGAQLGDLLPDHLVDVSWTGAAGILLEDTAAGARTLAQTAVSGARGVGLGAAAGVKSLGDKVAETREKASRQRPDHKNHRDMEDQALR
ncbi:MAG: hypothetical protein WAS02_09810 [Propionicimonas sp.]